MDMEKYEAEWKLKRTLHENFHIRTWINRKKCYFHVSTTCTVDAGYETMVFPSNQAEEIIDFGDIYCKRYSNEEEAIKGHEETIRKIFQEVIK